MKRLGFSRSALLWALFSGLPSSLSAHPLDQWQVRYATPTNQSGPFFQTVAFGQNLFVAVGTQGGIVTSTSGETWAIQSSGTTTNLQWVAYGNGTFVTVGLAGTILRSSNGTNWTAAVSGNQFDFNRVEFGNGIFVALSASGIYTSADGLGWTKQNPGVSVDSYVLGFGNGMFLTQDWAGKTNVISTNGIQWVLHPSGTPQNLYAIGSGKGLLLLIDTYDRVLSSVDAINWTLRGSVAQYRHRQVLFANGLYVACGGGRLEYSTDPADWMLTTNTTYGAASGLAFGHGTFVGAQGRYIVQSAPIVTLEALGGSRLSIAGPEDRAYDIQFADSISGPWRSITNISFSVSPSVWQDPQSASPGQRFYRAVLLP